ncbi:MAG: glucose-1-phosphate adenylyltransferase subunit GlgD [Clostridiales bacterium]|nr:glucose-1-phosphate adenylyltransferase subunit GlgD [Clostridiales bacterium]
MSTAGIIFSNIHDENISELTRIRTLASVPFGCRYRLIDFALSNMVNSNITNVRVLANSNYNSLIDHIGTGKDWDLSRRSGGIKLFPPNVMAHQNRGTSQYDTRLGILRSLSPMIASLPDDYVVLSDCDVICNIDLGAVIDEHIKTGADMTLVVKNMNVDNETASRNTFVDSDAGGRITDIMLYPTDFSGNADMVLNIIVMSRKYLYDIVSDAQVHNYNSLTRDVIARHLSDRNYRIYRCDGHFACISSLEHYFRENMELISNKQTYNDLFAVENRPILTKVRNSAPAYYSDSANVKNSLIADGCKIEGTVENCILFRGVKIGKGTTVKNSILFQDDFIGSGVSLSYVIADKNVVIRDNMTLSGCESLPFYIEKGKMI